VYSYSYRCELQPTDLTSVPLKPYDEMLQIRPTRNSSVTRMISGWMTRHRFPGGAAMFLFATLYKPVLSPEQLPIRRVPGYLPVRYSSRSVKLTFIYI
jgi:hypothetical protein